MTVVGAHDILFEERGRALLVTLNRPGALNALSLEMALQLEAALDQAAANDEVALVVIQGAGERAFCAGGDIRRLYDEGRAGGDYPRRFYRNEYRLNAKVFHFPKPYVALLDGIVMGGGVGVSVHGSHRVVTERVSFAMPETGIGLFPDVGGSYFLPRRPGRLGLYMALTGARLRAADALGVGVGDVEVASDRLPALIEALCEVEPGVEARSAVTAAIGRFAAPPAEPPLAARRAVIDETFGAASVEQILRALVALGDDWGRETAETIERKSPTSLKIAFRQLREGAAKSFNECMRMEYRIACGCIAGHDFYEGVRAVVVDKDQAPRWRPASLAAVPEAEIARYFEQAPPDGDLDGLPEEQD